MTYEPSPELADLLGALLDDEITVEESDRLAKILAIDDNARACYRELIETHAMMVWQRRSVGSLVDGLVDLEAAPVANVERLPIVGFLGGAFNSVASHMSQGWPLAYLLATVIFGIGLLIGSVVHVSEPTQVARQSSAPGRPDAEPRVEPVGRITGVVDCEFEEGSGFRVQASEPVVSGQWSVASGQKQSELRSASHQPPATSHLVSLGDKFALASGLLEITYDTGAKVILQGPVTYEVESAAGGFLSVGKLTARAGGSTKYGVRRTETADSGQWPVAGDNQQSTINNQQSSDPQPLIPSPSLSTLHSPLFTIKTPTATVTDLGTEFGVEVGKSGATAAHVFRGTVEVQPAADGDRPDSHVVRLVQNESVRIERRQGDSEAKVYRGKANAAAFVRSEQLRKLVEEQTLEPLRRWQAYSRQLRKDPTLVAYYPFESVGKDSWLLPNVAATGAALDGEIQGPLWTSGRFPGKVALRFRGPGTGAKVVLPDPQRFNFTGPFSLALWFQVARFSPGTIPALITKGGSAWRLQRCASTDCLVIDPCTDEQCKLMPHTEVTDRCWHLAVAVIEPRKNSHRKCLYLDGCLDSKFEIPKPLGRSVEPVWLGASSICPNREFEGRIDEVAIFSRVLSNQDIAAMFTAGNPAPHATKETNRDDK